MLSAHFIGPESGFIWDKIFDQVKSCIPDFDCDGRVTHMDMEKSIGISFSKHNARAEKFYDERHVAKNMIPHLGSERATAPRLYAKAMRAPSTEETDAIVASFGPNATAYLSKYPKSELFTLYSRIVDSIITSQGAEAAMHAALVNKIRCVEPTAMLHAMANTQRLKLAKNKSMAAGCTAAVPPRVEERIAVIIIAAKKYPSPVPVEGTNQMEWDVLSLANPALRRRVVLSQFRNTPPQCCAYSQTGSGFPCNHGAAVILEKHGAANMHKFISKRHLTGVWKEMYEGLEFRMPQQHEVDAVMLEAQKKVDSGEYLRNPKALPPPRGRPHKDAGARKKTWYETGTTKNKTKPRMCRLCTELGHDRRTCPLRQPGPDEGAEGGAEAPWGSPMGGDDA